jgi:hypothetical protein
MLKTLGEAHAELRKQPAPELTMGLLADCQSFALRIGQYIEDIEGEGTQTVSLLEEYCELAYSASADIGGANYAKKFRTQLIKIENIVRDELRPRRTEMVFLSYNASMSDSIESIYLAANADPSCDAYWIPIPYFERKVDGSFSQMHCDGPECYPNIECTDWREYDIAERHPDAIFTFAPYDAENLVTSVHPDFYCERLRDLTDCLVYTPYFVVADYYFVAADDLQANFCSVAGCVFAHKIIVQSEKVRDTYIRVFKAKYGNGFGKPEDKFIALGSPKFDKALNTKREDCKLPAEWRKLIGDKKVVLYNTNVGAILAGNEKYLEKLRSVFDTFRERGDIVLWWRPHPLNEATYRSMRPQLLREYKRITVSYKREGFGIYDDTPDLHRAIAWTDAYYGDWSSLVPLYAMTQKPMVLQDTDATSAFSELGVLFPLTLSVVNREVYYFMYSRNALLSFDLNSLTSRYLCSVPDKPVFGKEKLYHHSEIIDGKLYFAPFYSDDLAIFDTVTNSFRTVCLELQAQYIAEGEGKFYGTVRHKDMLFLLPHTYSAITAYNVRTEKTVHCLDLKDVFAELQDQIVNETSDKTNVYFHKYEWLDSSRILLPICMANCVLEFNLNDYSYVVHRIGAPNIRLCGIVRYGECFWVTAINTPVIYKWNYYENRTEEFTAFPTGFGKRPADKTLYFGRNVNIKYKSCLYLFPGRANMVCRVNMESGTIERLEEFDKYCERNADEDDVSCFDGSCATDDRLYLWSKEGVLLEYDFESRNIREFNALFRVSCEDNRRLACEFINSFVSGNETGLQECVAEAANLGNAGQTIFDYVKRR